MENKNNSAFLVLSYFLQQLVLSLGSVAFFPPGVYQNVPNF